MLDVVALLATVAMGCGGAPMDRQLPVSRSRSYTQPIDTMGVAAGLDLPAARVWTLVPAVLIDLGLDINFRVPAERRTGACYQRLHGRLCQEPLSTYVDCGETRSLPNADRYDVGLTVLVTVEPRGDGRSTIHTFVLGVGLDASGAASNRIWCFSKGALEERVRTGIMARAAS